MVYFKKRFCQRKGLAIISVMLLTVLMVMMTTSIIFISTNLLNMTGNVESKTQALKAAEAGVAYAYAELSADASWGHKNPDGTWGSGKTTSPPGRTCELQDNKGNFTVTFDSSDAYYSYNNLFDKIKENTSQTPAYTAKIISTGRSANGKSVERLQVIFVRADAYNSTVLAEGKISFGLAGEIDIFGKKKNSNFQPGRLHSNWIDPNNSLDPGIFTGNLDCLIKTDTNSPDRGMLSSCSAIDIEDTNYGGEKKSNAPRETIRQIDIDNIIGDVKNDTEHPPSNLPSGNYTIMRELGIRNYESNPDATKEKMGIFMTEASKNPSSGLEKPDAYVDRPDFLASEIANKEWYENRAGKPVKSMDIPVDNYTFIESSYTDCEGDDTTWTFNKDYTKMTAKGVTGKADYKLIVTYADDSTEEFNYSSKKCGTIPISPVTYELDPNVVLSAGSAGSAKMQACLGDTIALELPVSGPGPEGKKRLYPYEGFDSYNGLVINTDGSVRIKDDKVVIGGSVSAADNSKSFSDIIDGGNRFYLHVENTVYKFNKIDTRYSGADYRLDMGGKDLYSDTHAIFEMEVTGQGNIVSKGKVNFMQRVNSDAINVLAKDDLKIDFIPGAKDYYAKGLVYAGDDAKISLIGADSAEAEDNPYIQDMMARRFIGKDEVIDNTKYLNLTEIQYHTLPNGYSGYLTKSYGGLTIAYPKYEGDSEFKDVHYCGNIKLSVVPLDPNSPPDPNGPPVDPNCPYGIVAYDMQGNVIGDNYGLTGEIKALPSNLTFLYTNNRAGKLYTTLGNRYGGATGEPVITLDGSVIGMNNYSGDSGEDISVMLDTGSINGKIKVQQDLDYMEKMIGLQGNRVKVRISSWKRI